MYDQFCNYKFIIQLVLPWKTASDGTADYFKQYDTFCFEDRIDAKNPS